MNEFDTPVKCKDCGVWWRGKEHTCPPVEKKPSSSYETKPNKYPARPYETTLSIHTCYKCGKYYKTDKLLKEHVINCNDFNGHREKYYF